MIGRSCRSVAIAAIAFAAPACGGSPARADSPAVRQPARADAVPIAVAPARDSTWVDVQGPTLIAFFAPLSPAASDSGGEASEALDDFGYHLSTADSGLRALGYRVEGMPSRSFHVVTEGRAALFTVPRDSADLGYYFVAPGRSPRVYYGVQSNVDLVDAAREYLRDRAPRP